MDRAVPPSGPFSARLRHLLGGRKPTPWAQRLQIPAGTRQRMFQDDGIPPTYETLARIMRVENVSASWLLGAATPPFLVTRTSTDEETADILRANGDDTDSWRVLLLVGGDRCAWLLTDEGSLDDPRGLISYTALELIAGPSGPLTFAAYERSWPNKKLATRQVGPVRMQQIYRGRLGTYALLGDDETAGLINLDAIYDEAADFVTRQSMPRIREQPDGYTIDIAARLAKSWPSLAPEDQSALTIVADAVIARGRPPGKP